MTYPLAEKLRPQNLSELIGQKHVLSSESFLTQLIEQKKALSVLFWGPPGCGKTTLARIYGKALTDQFYQLSAVSSSTTEIKAILKDAEKNPLFNSKLVIFLDEIHRFNKSQQDLFLPYLESGRLILIGATTENPSFSLNNALLSRMRVFTLNALTNEDLKLIIERFESKNKALPLTKEAKEFLIEIASGDGRYLLNMIENLQFIEGNSPLDKESLKNILQKRAPLFDRAGDEHYNLISALHKSVRGSDPDAAIYWLARILNGGEDPLYIGRRLIRMASEDVGLADPKALSICLEAFKSYQILGSPEGELGLAQATLYLALAPKSNACYLAFKKANLEAEKSAQHPPPKHILNAPTPLMKELGYLKGYQYDHNCPDQFSGQNYFPAEMSVRPEIYQPLEIGNEREMKKRYDYFKSLRALKNKSKEN